MTSPVPAGQGRPRLQVIHGEGVVVDGQWASDHWDAGRLGIPARRGRGTAHFGGISQPWLREPVKRWSRFRLATGCAFATIDAGALALTRFSRFLAARHPEAGDASAITRPVLEDYLSWLVTHGYSASTRALSLSMIRVFFDACHRHSWLPGAPRVWWRLDSPQMLLSGWRSSSTVPPPGGTAGLIIFRFCFIEHLSSCAVQLLA